MCHSAKVTGFSQSLASWPLDSQLFLTHPVCMPQVLYTTHAKYLPVKHQDELFSLEQLYPEVEVADILATLVALVDVAFSSEPPESGLLQILPEEQPQNFPDLVPREELMVVAPAATGCGGVKTTTACDTPGRLVETLCLLALFLGTLAALYLFKPQPYFQ